MKARFILFALTALCAVLLLNANAGACDALGQQGCFVQQFQGYGIQQFAQPVYVQRVQRIAVPQRVYVQQFRQPQRFKSQQFRQPQRQQVILQNVAPAREEIIEQRGGFLGIGARTRIIRRGF